MVRTQVFGRGYDGGDQLVVTDVEPRVTERAARSERVLVVVFVINRNGTSFERNQAIVSMAPGSGSHETARTPSMSRRTPSMSPTRGV